MIQWVIKGIRTGIKTTCYPARPERSPGVSPGLPAGGTAAGHAAAVVDCCPTHALRRDGGNIAVDYRRCVHCFRCAPDLGWRPGYEWAGNGNAIRGDNRFGPAFRRSMHVLVVDAGDCGACLNEVRQLNSPYYNMHRLGFFITPTPRHADVLLVVGTVTDHMRAPLKKIFDAMPSPRRVVAVGACALSGGVFADSFVCSRGVSEILPVDVQVPGHPPPPLAILHGLLVAAGRRRPAQLET